MNGPLIFRIALGIVVLVGVGFAGWILSLPSTPVVGVAPPIAPAETAAMLGGCSRRSGRGH